MSEDEIEPLCDSLNIKHYHSNTINNCNSLNDSVVIDDEDLVKSQEFFRYINQDQVLNDDEFLCYRPVHFIDISRGKENNCNVFFRKFNNWAGICKRYIAKDLLRDISTVVCFIKSLLP